MPWLVFEENKGQWPQAVHYRACLPNGALFLEQNGFTYNFIELDTALHAHAHPHHLVRRQKTVNQHAIRVNILGAAKDVRSQASYPYSHYTNYFLGNDKNKWAGGVKSYALVTYQNLYPGINMEWFGRGNEMKYQFVLSPGANPDQIALQFKGAEALSIINNELFINTSFHYFKESAPYAYQLINGEKVEVDCRFVLKGNVLSYALGTYNKAYELIIDPVLIFSTYSGSTADNFGFTATYDNKGNFYSGGTVRTEGSSGRRFPATTGAYQTVEGGGNGGLTPINAGFPCDIGISKFDSSGSSLIWATYLGGRQDEFPHSLIVDDNEELIVLGTTFSANFPVSSAGFDTTFNGRSDIFITRFSADGSSLVGGTFLGGSEQDGLVDQGPTQVPNTAKLVYNYADNFRGDVNIHPITKHIYIASVTLSANIPTTANALSTALSGDSDGLIAVFDAQLSNLEYCSYIGGDRDDALYSLKFNNAGDIFVAGGTTSSNLPTTTGALFPTYGGGRADGFFFRLAYPDYSLKHLSYIGTAAYDQTYFCDLDRKGQLYLFGQTTGNMLMTPNVYGQPGTGLFITILDSGLTAIKHQTTFGTRPRDPNISPSAFVVDLCDRIYISGWGSVIWEGVYHSGTTQGLPVSPNAIRTTTDNHDFYLAAFDRNLQSLLYATYFGGTQTDDHVDGGTSRFDKNGVVYQSICGSCPGARTGGAQVSDIPTTPNAVFPSNDSYRCSNTSIKIDFQLKTAVIADFIPSPVIGCVPMQVNFQNRSTNGKTFYWNFGNGQMDSSNLNPSMVYEDPGDYFITLVVIDSNTCNVSDTIRKLIKVLDRSEANFEYEIDLCDASAQFRNTSDNAISYLWRFGDGDSATTRDAKKKFTRSGSHQITLITNPGTRCADTISQSISIDVDNREPLFIPNIITPNQDSLNNCFRIKGLLSCDEVKIEIFNRYAQKVFESTDLNFCWDGTNQANGQALASGVYYTVIDHKPYGEEAITYKGTITLIRN